MNFMKFHHPNWLSSYVSEGWLNQSLTRSQRWGSTSIWSNEFVDRIPKFTKFTINDSWWKSNSNCLKNLVWEPMCFFFSDLPLWKSHMVLLADFSMTFPHLNLCLARGSFIASYFWYQCLFQVPMFSLFFGNPNIWPQKMVVSWVIGVAPVLIHGRIFPFTKTIQLFGFPIFGHHPAI